MTAGLTRTSAAHQRRLVLLHRGTEAPSDVASAGAPQYGDTVLGLGPPLARCGVVVTAQHGYLAIGGAVAYLALGAFIVLIVGLTWLSSRRRQRSTGCCAPADPRDDVRMSDAFDEDMDGRPPDRRTR